MRTIGSSIDELYSHSSGALCSWNIHLKPWADVEQPPRLNWHQRGPTMYSQAIAPERNTLSHEHVCDRRSLFPVPSVRSCMAPQVMVIQRHKSHMKCMKYILWVRGFTVLHYYPHLRYPTKSWSLKPRRQRTTAPRTAWQAKRS